MAIPDAWLASARLVVSKIPAKVLWTLGAAGLLLTAGYCAGRQRAQETAGERIARSAESSYRLALAARRERLRRMAKDSADDVRKTQRFQQVIAGLVRPQDVTARVQAALAKADSARRAAAGDTSSTPFTPTFVIVGEVLPPLDTLTTLGYTRKIALAGTQALAAKQLVVDTLRAIVRDDSTLFVKADSAIAAWKDVANGRRCRILWLIPCPTRTVTAIGSAVIGSLGTAYVLGRR